MRFAGISNSQMSSDMLMIIETSNIVNSKSYDADVWWMEVLETELQSCVNKCMTMPRQFNIYIIVTSAVATDYVTCLVWRNASPLMNLRYLYSKQG